MDLVRESHIIKIRAKTNIPNIRISVHFETNIRLNLHSIRVDISHYFWKFLILLRKW